jgi:hypothetical protein
VNRSLLAAFLLFTALDVGAAVTGTVLGDDAKPLAGVRVRVFPREGSRDFFARLLSETPERGPLSTSETKSDGTFSADTKSAALVDVVVDAPGHQFLRLEGGDGEDLGAVMLRTAPMRRGRVTANGKPVVGARIAFGHWTILKTDEKGEYEVPDTTAFERLLVIHPDFAIGERPTADAGLNLEMAAGSPIRGRVSGPDGQPVAHATVLVNGWPLAQSGDDGSFTVPHAPEKWRTFIVRAGSRVSLITNRGAGHYEVTLRPAATLSGSVRSTKDDSPVAGSYVVISRGDDQSLLVLNVSDARGRFAIDGLPAGHYGVSIQHPGYAVRGIDLQLGEGASETRMLAVSPLSRLSGRVIGEDRQPIAGARVGSPMMPRRSSVTNTAGTFVVRIASAGNAMMMRPSEVFVSKDGYATARYGPVSVASGETKSGITIVLPKGFPLDVKAVDRDNRPVAGAAVAVQRWNDDAGASRSAVSCRENDREHCRATDADGVMHFQLSEGKYDVQVTGDTVATRRMTVMLNARSSPLIVSVDHGVEISGRVAYADGSPVNEVGLSVRSEAGPARLQGDGTFVIRNAPAGTATLTAEVLGSPPGNPPVKTVTKQVTAPATGVVLTLARNGRIEGRVVDKATHDPLRAFQLLALKSGSTRRPQPHPVSSEDGTFSLDLEPGSVDLSADAPGYVRAISTGLKIEEGKTTSGIELQLDHGGKITGRVTSNGRPLADANVVAQKTTDARMMASVMMQTDAGSATTDANGEFTLDGVAPGERVLAISKPDFVRKEKSTAVAADRETHVEVELDRGLELHGRVVDHDGRPLSDVRVNAREMDRGPAEDRFSISDVEGLFRLSGLGDRPLTVTADKGGYVRASVDNVVPATSELTITLDRGGSISGRVVGVSDAELPLVFVTAGGSTFNSRTDVDSTGNFTLQGIPDGRVMVSLVKRPMFRTSVPKVVEVVHGSAAPVELSFDDANTIRGRVTRAGAPVDNGSISFLPATPGGRSAWATISAGGSYEANGVLPGDYNVSVRIGLMAGLTYNEKHSVRGGETYDIDIHGATIRGRVVDDTTGVQISDAAVWLDAPRSPGRGAATDSNGTFVMEAVGEGKYGLRAQKDGYAAGRQELVVTDGDEDVELRLRPATRTTLRIVDARNNRGIPASVGVMDKSGKPLLNGSSRGDEPVSIWLEPGNYTGSIWARGYVSRSVTIVVPGPEVQVALQPAGKLVINVQTSARARLAIVPAETAGANRVGGITLDPGSSFPFDSLPPGSYVVELFGEGETVARRFPVTITAGETTTLTVQ